MPSCGKRASSTATVAAFPSIAASQRLKCLGRLLRPLHFRFQRGQALGNRGRGFQLGPETTSHGLHAEDEGRARHRFYSRPMGFSPTSP